jgi:hypothetical protein
MSQEEQAGRSLGVPVPLTSTGKLIAGILLGIAPTALRRVWRTPSRGLNRINKLSVFNTGVQFGGRRAGHFRSTPVFQIGRRLCGLTERVDQSG